MATAQEILNERLARGEISEAEHERLSARISAQVSNSASPSVAQPAPVSGTAVQGSAPTPTGARPIAGKPAKRDLWRNIAIIGVGLVIVAVVINQLSSKVKIGDISASGQRVTFGMANTSSSRQDVVFWIEQDEISKCTRRTQISANNQIVIKFRCPDLKDGTFMVFAGSASTYSDKARFAAPYNSSEF